ncbi:tetratricopeptide repeat protein [Rhodocaloribacter sp.]
MRRFRFCLVLVVFGCVAGVAPAQSPEGWLARGDSLREAGATEAAEAAYEQARAEAPDDPAAYLRLGALALDLGRWGDAAGRFDEALERAPDDLAAHYYRALAHRERGRFRTPIEKVRELLEWGKAEKHFEWVLARDSTFRDVLFQYAVLEAYRGDYGEALERGREQLRLRPDLPSAHVGLFRLYRRFLRRDEAAATAWLAAHDDAYAAFFRAERMRRRGANDEALEAFRALERRPGALPRASIALALARVFTALGLPDAAAAQFRRAVDGIETPVDAAFVFEDVKHILSPEELHAYRALREPEAFRVFFRRLWARRDPLPAAAENARLIEHYRRLVYVEEHFAYDGFREWWNDPDKRDRLVFPEGYRLSRDFNDKGLVYLRHGPPDDRVATLGADVPGNESWRYEATDDLPPMVFHFSTLGGANWRLVPVLLGPEMMSDRVAWGEPFTRGYLIYQEEPHRRDLSLLAFREEMRERSQADVDVGLTTDRHTWPAPVEPLEAPVVTAAFRGAGGQTDVAVWYAFPTVVIARHAPPGARRVDVEIGLSVRAPDGREAFRRLVTRRLTLSGDPTGGVIDGFAFTAKPDSYRVALHVRPAGTGLLGTFRLDRRLPDFSRPGLAMSDVLAARNVAPAEGAEGPFVRRGFRIDPAPTLRFRTGRPLFVYFEIYHLTPGDDGRTHYTLTYTLTPVKPRRRGLFRRKQKGPTLSLSADHESAETAPVEYAEIDVRKVEPDAYFLTVAVTDRQTGQTVSRTRVVTLEGGR